MIRIFNAYFPVRSIILLVCEAMLILGAFLAATSMVAGPDTYIALIYQNGILKIICVSGFTLLLSYYFDLYQPALSFGAEEIYFRLLLMLSTLSFCLAVLVYLFPSVAIGPSVFLRSIVFLTFLLVGWRLAYNWIVSLPALSERVYVLGDGRRAQSVVGLLRARPDLGMMLVEGSGALNVAGSGRKFVEDVPVFNGAERLVDRIVVALEDRRGSMPVQELLELHLQGVIIEEAGSLIERLSGRVPLDGLDPSALIFTSGFNLRAPLQIARRLISILAATLGLLMCLPLIPFIILAVRLSSPGAIIFRQVRVGQRSRPFTIYKFRTMRQDAESNGAQWAVKNDCRITPLGRFMRKTRLDEIPQLWNVLIGDMGFVGPRPERPEFVEWLAKEIPYYNLRHTIRPGLTGWAQVSYQYGASLQETRRKLEYDFYYIKHMSVGLDFLIMFQTMKTIVLRKGAQ
jgi:sugar transferase (PEP-CTERM system associated)